MQAFGVNFRVDQEDLFPSLVSVFEVLKEAKSSEDFSDAKTLEVQLSAEVKSHFYWPTDQEKVDAEEARANLPIRITEPSEALGGKWDLGSLLHAIENGEYNLLEIIKTSDSTAELRIDPEAYPYGGIGAFMALVEAHGMHILGVNEYGKYQSREELLGLPEINDRPASKKSWWRFWQ
jgi:hypothetical protein